MTHLCPALSDAVTAYQNSLAAARAAVDMTATALMSNPREALTDTTFLRHLFKLLREGDDYLLSRAQTDHLEDAMTAALRTLVGESFSRLRFMEGHFSATLELNVDKIGGVENFRTSTKLADDLRDISYALDRAAGTTLEITVITKQSSIQDTFVVDPYDNNVRRTAWNSDAFWYGHKMYATLADAFTATFTDPKA